MSDKWGEKLTEIWREGRCVKNAVEKREGGIENGRKEIDRRNKERQE